jgi:asparagine synthase (glutamine-hydrolysing)
MCAIAGILGLPARRIDEMLATMARRGPDGNGVYTADGCTLLHARLAIIDPAGGAQPMILQMGEQRYILVYNGELYNTAELRRDLEQQGHRFEGHSDTEVVLHAYVQWGDQCVERFNGIFAFAVWEQGRGRLFLARDRIGVKPLFYKLHNGGLLFASEIKTILSYPTVDAELGSEGAAQILLFGPGRLPGSGVFRGIQELEPGCKAFYEQGKLTVQRYWKLRDREHTEDFETTSEHVRYLVTDAIRRQMVSDVPIGCFLSGGLDSSIISAVCAHEKPGLDTFSVDYQDNERYFVSGKFQPNADGDYIRLMADTIQSRHHWTVLTPKDLVNQIEAATLARDLPGMADVDFSLLAFCGEIRKNVKVALSGECADEIFGGYPWYRDPAVRDTEGFPWAQNTADRIALMHPQIRDNLNCLDFVREQYQKTLDDSDVLPGMSALERRMKQMVNLNFRWFMQTLLDRKDRMSMYHGLEVRVPFCDYRIAEYLYGVPWTFKDYQGREKGLLRYAVEGLLPEQVLYRKKSPYPKTHHPACTQMVSDALKDVLEQQNAPLFELLSRQAIEKYLKNEQTWPWYGQLMTRPQTMAYFLQINFWLTHYKIRLV